MQLTNIHAGDDDRAAVAALTPLLDIGRLLDQEATHAPYAAVLPRFGGPHSGGRTRPLVGSGLAVHLGPDVSKLIAESMRAGATGWLAIRPVGGAVNDVDPRATAYAHRHQNFAISDIGIREAPFRARWDELRAHLDGLYINFESDHRPERLADAYPGETLTRLRRVTATYDPDTVFNQNFPIPPGVECSDSAVPVSALAPPAVGVDDDEPAGEDIGRKQRHGRGGEPPVETGHVDQARAEKGDFDDDGDSEDPTDRS